MGGGVVLGAFKILGAAESTESFSLQDMIGSTGRVSVGIPANRYGTVLISFAGASSVNGRNSARLAEGHAVAMPLLPFCVRFQNPIG